MTTYKTAGIIIIGNEILSGKVQDTNASFLASELRELGIDVMRISIIPDEVDVIAREVMLFSEAYDVVFTSGGVGPTHDDVTMEGIAKGLGVDTEVNEYIAGVVNNWCGEGDSDPSMKMAVLPKGALLLATEELKFPPVAVENVIIFPGIPEYLRSKFLAIKERFRSEPFILKKLYIGVEECYIVAALNKVDCEFKDVLLGSYPKIDNPDYKVVLTIECKDCEPLDKAYARLMELLPQGCIVKEE